MPEESINEPMPAAVNATQDVTRTESRIKNETPTKTDTGGGAPKGAEPRSALLARQIANKVDLEGKSALSAPVPLSKLLSLATGGQKCRLYLGWAFAGLAGGTLPTFFFFMGPVFDSMTVNSTAEEARDAIRKVVVIMGCLAAGITFVSFL